MGSKGNKGVFVGVEYIVQEKLESANMQVTGFPILGIPQQIIFRKVVFERV